MVSRPLLRILPLVVTAAAFFGMSGTALATGDSPPVCVPFMQSVAPYPASREVDVLNPFAFCTDPDTDLLTYTVSGGTKGTLDTSDIGEGSFTYAPATVPPATTTFRSSRIDPSGARSQPVAITMRITIGQPGADLPRRPVRLLGRQEQGPSCSRPLLRPGPDRQ